MARPTVPIYPVENYTFGVKEAAVGDNVPLRSRLDSLKQAYAQHGMGLAVEVVLAIHLHQHPHVLLLQKDDTYQLYGLPPAARPNHC